MSQGIDWTVVSDRREYARHQSAAAGLFEAAFHREFPRAGWEMYYLENPAGSPIVSLAYAGATLIAHQALIPGIATGGNTEIRYHLSISTMVHPEHRSMPVFMEMFARVHEQASAQGSGFVLGFPNANLYTPLRRCFGYQTIVDSPLRNWTPPKSEPAGISPDPSFGRSGTGQFGPPATAEYWTWRTRLNHARAVVVNGRLRIVYKRLAGNILNVLNVEPGTGAISGANDLAGLAAAEGCPSVRIADHHASRLGIAAAELTDHENYRIRMTALPLNNRIPDLQFNLAFCDIF